MKPRLLSVFLLLFLLSNSWLGAQKITAIRPASPPAADTASLEVSGYNADSLIKFTTSPAGLAPQPFYRYLYIFGDGNFINGVRDSIVKHQFATPDGTLDAFGNYRYDVTVYASDSYGGGDPPPDKSLQDTIVIDKGGKGGQQVIVLGNAPPVLRSGVTLNPVIHRLSATSATVPVVDSNRYVYAQKNHDFRPKDTTVVIVSAKNPNPPGQAQSGIAGQIYLFYNGQIENISSISKSADPATFANFSHNRSLIYNEFSWEVVVDTVAPVVDYYQRVLVLSYVNLRPGEERHFFFEFSNNSELLDYIDLAGEDTARVRFLALVTAVNDDTQNLQSVLTPAQLKRLNTLKINTYLQEVESTLVPDLFNEMLDSAVFDVDDLPFNGDFPSVIDVVALDMSELSGDIVASKDPNHMDGIACKCGGNDLVFYEVRFMNDGLAPTQQIFVDVGIPSELDISSIADTSFIPAGGLVEMSLVAPDTVRFWLKNTMLFPTATYGMGHPATEGRIRFSIRTAAGSTTEDVPPVNACIRFDSPAREPLCTNFAHLRMQEAAVADAGIQAVLNCEECPWYCEICELLAIQVTLVCILVLLLAGVLILVLLWLLKKMF